MENPGTNAFVYLLRCRDGTLYAGWTNDLKKRLAVHNSGQGAKYTRSRLPVRLAYWERCPDRHAALRRECALKAMTRREKLELIRSRGDWEGMAPPEDAEEKNGET